jgi:hypothetical protein
MHENAHKNRLFSSTAGVNREQAGCFSLFRLF